MNYQKIKNLQKIKDNFEQVSKELKNLLTTFQKISAKWKKQFFKIIV